MFKKTISHVGRWIKNEDGFEVFEKFGLTQGGVLLALGITAVAVYAMSSLWNSASAQLGANGLNQIAPANLANYQAAGWVQ